MSAKNNIKKILIVDDFPIIRFGLKKLIEKEKDIKICGDTASVNEAVNLITNLEPDLIILDMLLEGSVSGINLLRAIKNRFPFLFSLVFSVYDEPIYAEHAIKAGAKGYITKKESDMVVIEAIRKVMNGELYLSNNISLKIVGKLLGCTDGNSITLENRLSEREFEIFHIIGSGLGTKEIARKLNLSVNTIESHKRHIKQKLNIKDSNNLMKHAVQWMHTQNK
ncbi:MAG: response regulator transcription factor [Spirochaetota bacterium]|nr:response regulator transcription factor [Spirochaetota bacterium]